MVVGEGLAAGEAQERGVAGPDDGGEEDEAHETAEGLAGQPGREGHDRAPARDEPRRDQQDAAADLELAARPLQPGLGLGLVEEPALEGRPEVPSEKVGRGVAQEGADHRAADDGRQPEVTLAGGDAAEDHHRLARDDRDHRVEVGDDGDDQVEPRRGRQVLEVLQDVAEEVEHRSTLPTGRRSDLEDAVHEGLRQGVLHVDHVTDLGAGRPRGDEAHRGVHVGRLDQPEPLPGEVERAQAARRAGARRAPYPR